METGDDGRGSHAVNNENERAGVIIEDGEKGNSSAGAPNDNDSDV